MNKIIFVLLLTLSSGASAAEYIIGFKSPEAQQRFIKKSSNLPLKIVHNLEVAQTLIISSDMNPEVLLKKESWNIAFIEKESFRPAPPAIVTKTPAFKPWSLLQAFQNQATPEESLPYGLHMMNVPEAWNTSKGQGARVMVIDSGVDKNHPLLKNKIEKVFNFISKTDDFQDATDDVGHGTHVAGIIAADRNSFFSGVAPEAKLLIAKVCDAEKCHSTAVAQALAWALKEKVDVVNLSLGGNANVSEKFVIDKLDSAQIPVVAAAGNEGWKSVAFPAAFPSVIAVGAINDQGQKAPFSNWGPSLNIVAPGVRVLSSVPLGEGRISEVMFTENFQNPTRAQSITFTTTPFVEMKSQNNLVYLGFGKEEDYREGLAHDKIVLVDRGELALLEKVRNATHAGAKALIILNNHSILTGGSIATAANPLQIPVIIVDQNTGHTWKEILRAQKPLEVSLSIQPNDYAEFDGTSMASPYVAGVVALMRSLKPRMGSWRIRQIIYSTATPAPAQKDDVQLPGIINAEKAVLETLKYKR